MDSEIQSFIMVWLTAIVSAIFCHQIVRQIPSGAARLLSLLPIIYLFTILPLRLSSFHLGGATIATLVWVGNFNLLLFAFNQGPLSTNPPLSLLHFILVALLPINPNQSSSKEKTYRPIHFPLKCGLLGVVLICFRQYRESAHPYLITCLYCSYVYLVLELSLAITATLVRAVLGLELEPHFNEPYLATSLQDYWGRRWNLVMSSILHRTVYFPMWRISARILGKRWATRVSTLATFLVSGLMHEVLLYYLTRTTPSWELSRFFVLQGFLVVVEIELKRAALSRGWRLHRAVSVPLTVGILVVMNSWMFFPVAMRHRIDQKVINEHSAFLRYFRDILWPA